MPSVVSRKTLVVCRLCLRAGVRFRFDSVDFRSQDCDGENTVVIIRRGSQVWREETLIRLTRRSVGAVWREKTQLCDSHTMTDGGERELVTFPRSITEVENGFTSHTLQLPLKAQHPPTTTSQCLPYSIYTPFETIPIWMTQFRQRTLRYPLGGILAPLF